MSKRKLVSLINEMLYRDWYKAPETYYGMTKARFMLSSYSTWALHELKLYAMKNTKEDPITCVENFRSMMDKLACEAKTSEANFMYSTCYDVATDVLDMMLVT